MPTWSQADISIGALAVNDIETVIKAQFPDAEPAKSLEEAGLSPGVHDFRTGVSPWIRIRLKFYRARRVWPMRDEFIPSKEMTWGEWFKARHDQSLEDYREEVQREGLKERIKQWELDTYGETRI